MNCKIILFMGLIQYLLGACGTTKQMPEGKLVSFSFSTSEMAMYSGKDYWLDTTQEGAVTLGIRMRGQSQASETQTDAAALDSVLAIMQKHKVHLYKESYKPHEEILDGDSWRFSASFDSGKRLYSSGSNAYPEDWAFGEITAFLDTLIN
jgi:hypothetical protein